MGAISIWHIAFVVLVLVVLFGGRGKISGLMGDTAKGIKAFREGLKGDDEPKDPPKTLSKDEKEKDAAA